PLVVFRSRMKSFNDFIGSLFTVGLDAELPQQLPVPRGGFVSFSPDDSKMAYNRVFREFRTWKHYRGGMADDIWIYDFKTGATENLTNNPAQDICPMWAPDNKIYFLSDRDNRMNLFVVDLATKEIKQLTHFTDFDIKFPSIGKDEPQQITNSADTYYYAPKWSPDSKTLLWSDRLQRLRYVDVASKSVTLVDQDKYGEIESYNWSPDSQWITWVRPEENGMPRV